MRKYLMGAAALLACTLPGVASANTGYVGADYRDGKLGGTGATDFNGWAGSGAVAFDAGPAGIQLGADAVRSDFGIDIDNWGVDAHVYQRGEHWQVGGGLGYNTWQNAVGVDVHTWTAAGEVLFFQPNTTWSGVISYSKADPSFNPRAIMLDVGVRHFVTDNFSLSGGLGIGKFSGGGFDYDNSSANVGAEYQFAGTPISIYGGYSHNNLTFSPDVPTDFFSLGARWNFGGGSLRERDRTGANLTQLHGPYERLYGM